MSETEQRQIERDSLFVMAGLRVAGSDKDFKVKIRNLSAGGLMAEGGPRVVRGMPVTIDVRNVGPVAGVVAWVQDTRFGIAFDEEIDPKAVRNANAVAGDGPAFRMPMRSLAERLAAEGVQSLRKV